MQHALRVFYIALCKARGVEHGNPCSFEVSSGGVLRVASCSHPPKAASVAGFRKFSTKCQKVVESGKNWFTLAQLKNQSGCQVSSANSRVR